MGSIYRPTFTNAAGKRVQCKTYRIAYVDENGDRQTEKGYRDRRATETKLRQLEDRVEQIRSGRLNAGAAAPWKDSVQLYLTELRRLGRSAEYLKEIERALGKLFNGLSWGTVSDATADGLTGFLGQLAADGRSPRTVNHYRDTLCGLLSFGVRQGWLLTNPVAIVPKTSLGSPGDTSRRPRARRAFTLDEFQALVQFSPNRAILYQVAAFSGLRRREVHLLEKQDAAFAASGSGVWQLRPEITKGKRFDQVPMTPDCAEVLRPIWDAAAEPTDRLFPRRVNHRTFKADLGRAGIARRDHRGRQADFHGLRYFFCVRMGLTLPIQVVRVLMRHRDIRTTCNLYMDLGIADAVDRLAELPRVVPQTAADNGDTARKPRSRRRKSENGKGVLIAHTLAASLSGEPLSKVEAKGVEPSTS